MGHLYHGYVSHNQMVTDFIHQFLILVCFTQAGWVAGWVAGGCWDDEFDSSALSQRIIPENSRKTHQEDYGEFWEWKMMENAGHFGGENHRFLASIGNFSARGRSWGNL